MIRSAISPDRKLISLYLGFFVLALPLSALAQTTIGPDASGYRATNAVVYSFIDISSTGSSVLAGTDDDSAILNLGFSFNFYGHDYTTACISSNGLISFGGCNVDFANVDLTSASPTGDLPSIAPLWMDLTFSSPGAGAVFYQTLGAAPNRRFVIQWNNAFVVNGPKGLTFQTILTETTNQILFQYKDLNAGVGSPASSGALATVGIRAAGSITNGHSNGNQLQWSMQAPVLRDSLSIQFLSANFSADTVAPTTLTDASPAANANGWNKANVTVNLFATDNVGGSGVKELTYSLSGAQNETRTVSGGAATVPVSGEGTTALTFFAADNAGNKETPKTRSFRIDKSTPLIQGMPAAGCSLWPPNGKFVQIGVVTANDSLSGLASFTVTGTSNEPANARGDGNTEPDIIITGTGTGPRTIQVRAERSASGTGRVYSLTATAVDLADNLTTVNATCRVPHDQGK